MSDFQIAACCVAALFLGLTLCNVFILIKTKDGKYYKTRIID